MNKGLLDRTVKVVCACMCEGDMPVTPAEVMRRGRTRNVAIARQMVFFIMRKHYDKTLEGIAKPFGVDHATVFHGAKVTLDRIEREWEVADVYKKVLHYLSLNPINMLVLKERPAEAPKPEPKQAAVFTKEEGSHVVPMMWTTEERHALAELRKQGATMEGFASGGGTAHRTSAMVKRRGAPDMK